MSYNIGMVSLGCDKNRIDAENMLGILKNEGYNIVSQPENAEQIRNCKYFIFLKNSVHNKSPKT